MAHMDDWQLLRDYAAKNSEASFRVIVERYAGVVYHAALRQVGNQHTAEEITQGVFIVLARKAAKIRPQPTLYGWLFRATRYAVLNRLREDANRARREHDAAAMHSMNESDSAWEQIAPELDSALERLPAADRELLMGRFFGNRTYEEIASAMGVSEDAVRKRLSRALERLRIIFGRRGIVLPIAVLTAAFTAHAAQAAPAGLAAAVTTAAANSAANLGGAAGTAKGILQWMAWAKAKTAVAAAVVILAAAGTTTMVVGSKSPPALPGEVLAELQKQKAAMRDVSLTYTNTANWGNGPWPEAISNYFDANRFWKREITDDDHETAFDGKMVSTWQHPTVRPGMNHPMPDVLEKYFVTPGTDPDRAYRKYYFPYLDDAGYYVPTFSRELETFSAVEPLAQHYLRESPPTKVEDDGGNLRVTFRVKDRWLENAREFDAEEARKKSDNGANSKEFVAKEVENVNRWHAMDPVRTVELLLDSQHGYAVAERREWTAADQLIAHFISDDWHYYDGPGIWLPNRCVTYYYVDHPLMLGQFFDAPHLTNICELSGIEFGKKRMAFALKNTDPGATVIDHTTREARSSPGGKVIYQVAANGALVRPTPRGAGAATMTDTIDWSRLLLIFGLALGGLVAIVCFITHRRTA